MDYPQLNRYNLSELKNIAREMNLTPRRSKKDMVNDISNAFKEYERYKRRKSKYTRTDRKLGADGKEGITYLAKDKRGREYAMKTFRKTKSSDRLRREYQLQERCASEGIAPQVYDYDTVEKYIVMEKMDSHLLDLIKKQGGKLYRYQQIRLIEIFRGLDNAGVFHRDSNILNYMVKGRDIYIIDFGMSKEITPRLQRELGTNTPNMKIMLLGFILKLKDFNFPLSSCKHLISHLNANDRKMFQLE
jgi:tRNA A-37 threonylcarbamoyl transferase component Bud32